MSSNIPSSSGQQPSLSRIHFDPSETETFTIEHQIADEKNNDDIIDKESDLKEQEDNSHN